MPKYDVTAIGNAIVDILAKVEDHFIATHHLTKGSMSLIDEDQAHKIHTDMTGVKEMISGGSAANTAVGLASLGSKVAFIGKVKDDEVGKVFTTDLRESGVDYGTKWATGNAPATAKCVISITPDAQRTMATFLGATRTLTEDDIDETLIASSKVIYLEGYLWDEPNAIAAMRKALEIAKRENVEVAFTLSDLFCVERHRDAFFQMIKEYVTILFGNEDEFRALFQDSELDHIVAELPRLCDIAVMTRGEKGSIVFHGEEAIATEALALAEVVDTTGAGDLFASGFLHGYTSGKTLAESAQIANLVAGEIISHIGARPEADLTEMLKNYLQKAS